MAGLIAQYGLALVFANVLIQQMGLPVPVVPTLILAGASAGNGNLSAAAIFAVAFAACAVSDATWYAAGRLYGRRVLKLLCRISLSPDSCMHQSESQFRRWGRIALVLAKFVPGLSMITPSLAGAMRLNWPLFALLDGLGAAIWTGSTIGLGMLLHQEIGRLVAPLQQLEPVAIGFIATLLAGYISMKWWQRRRFYDRLRMARITVDELHKLMAEGQRPLVVDLRTSLVRDQDSRIIPGALVANIADVEQWRDQLPTDREIIFYCTCPNETGAAYVARQLMNLGYARVRPLLGGLDAWVAAGFEVGSGPVTVAGRGSFPAFSPAVLRGTADTQAAAIGAR